MDAFKKVKRMVNIHTAGNVLFTEVHDKLTKEDFDQLTPVLETLIAAHGKIRWYFEMQDFHGWDLGGLMQDLKESVKHATHLEKVAMVGDKGWEKGLTTAMKPFTSATVHFFDLAEKEEARRWIAV